MNIAQQEKLHVKLIAFFQVHKGQGPSGVRMAKTEVHVMRKKEVTMFDKKLKLTLAGVLIASGISAIALKSAWATPGSKISTTIIAGPTALGDNHVKSESDVNEVHL